MFSETDLNYYLEVQHKLPPTAVDYIKLCYFGEPSRQVGTHAKTNVVSWVPSTKLNGKTFSTESRGAERALNTLAQFDDNILWHGDQPPPISVVKTIKGGVKRRNSYTPDALSLTNIGPRVFEVKTLGEVDSLLINNPDDWVLGESGEVIFKPAREEFEHLGLHHVVYVYKSEERCYIANLNQILWARESEDLRSPDMGCLQKVMSQSFTLSLSELKQELKLSSITPLIMAIDAGHIVADLKGQLLTNPDDCLVSANQALLEHGQQLRDAQRVYWPGLVEAQSLAIVPSLKGAEDALRRLEAVRSGLTGRSVRRWLTCLKGGEAEGLSEFQSLISRYDRSGNAKSKLNPKVDQFLTSYLQNDFIQKQGMSIYRGFIDYKFKARKVHPEFNPVCRKTFTRHFGKIPPEVVGYARGGKRKGNANAYPTDPQERHLKAQTAWEVAAIDHYKVDLYLVFYAKTGKVFVERPWLTLMIDLATGKVLAFSVSFLNPSRRSVAKVIRACVRKHGKLPREIIVDRGSDFKSVYFASLLAHYSVIRSLRPASHPRFGGEVEGFFGEFKDEWLSQREGNLADFQEARSVDGKKTPDKAAVLSPVDFLRELACFCNWRENKCRGTGSYSSEALFETTQMDFPHIPRNVEYDDQFIAVTAVESKNYTVNMQRGINIEGTWYSSDSMQLLLGRPRKNEVRLDPENPNLIFVKVRDKWVPFYSSEINAYSYKSGEHQLAECMIKHEAANLKRRIREEDDIELASLYIRWMSTGRRMHKHRCWRLR